MQTMNQTGDRQARPAALAEPSRRWPRRPPTGLAGAFFWLAVAFGLLLLLRMVLHHNGQMSGLLGLAQLLSGLALFLLAVLLGWRLVHRHLLWSLRNKLILTYLLIGLAPVLMLLTFVAISAYIAAGQFSIHLADTRMRQQLDELGVESSSRASRLARVMRDRAVQPSGQPEQGPRGLALPGGAPGGPVRRRPRPAVPGAGGGAAPGGARSGFTARTAARNSLERAAQVASDAAAAAQTAAQLAAQLTATQTANQTATLDEAAPDPLLTRLHRHSSVYLNGVPYYATLSFAALSAASGPQSNPVVPQPTPSAQPTSSVQPTRAAQASTTIPHLGSAEQPTAAAQPGNVPPNAPGQTAGPRGLPPWAEDLHGNQFRGLVLDGHELFLVAIDQRRIEGSGLLSVVTSMPVDSSLMDVVAEGLGRVQLTGMNTGRQRTTPRAAAPSATSSSGRRSLDNDIQHATVYGGEQPQANSFFDVEVPFLSTLDIRDWQTSDPDNVPIAVHSRPSVLYSRLFGSSLGGIVTRAIRTGLIVLCIVFALIESLALWMALRLSRAITTSVEELYAATQRVDRGDLVHRIAAAPAGKRDQLGELARSFNRMTGSLERLLVEQHEKERMQNELNIAHEVQTNLFPHRVGDLPALQLHGICRPARTVSGDYYDFLLFRHPDNPDGTRGAESGVGIALGDISGKGISAALLMATLHSAVRAYRLAGEDLVYSESAIAALTASREDLAGDSGKLFESPGRILSLLNRHLYRSTQPEKYATLFLAHYDAATAQLTYSNPGHLPPIGLSRDGTARRLERGGTVVGLMDGMRYEEGRIQMLPGDIFVAYSDGITEPENESGEFGEERLLEIVARFRDQPLAVISDQVLLALDAWIGGKEQPDDITLVLARQA